MTHETGGAHRFVSMSFCRNCGRELPLNASLCPACGANISAGVQGVAPPYENEFDRLTRDSGTQEHWVRRVVAYVIDVIIVGVVAFFLSLVAFLISGLGSALFLGSFALLAFNPFSYFAGLSALLYLLYFALSDYTYQKTLGKSLMGLAVTTTDGSKLDLGKCLIRNVSKVYWLFLFLDLLIGFFSHVRPGQKFSDHYANTAVVLRP